MAILSRKEARQKRHRRVRRKVAGTAEIPRMSMMVSGRNIYVQFIDDDSGVTLAQASSVKHAGFKSATVDVAREIGKVAAENAVAKGIKRVVVDRGGFRFHGRIKAIVDAACENGLVMSMKETT